jgi:AhpD family alkylhydroperoxidase
VPTYLRPKQKVIFAFLAKSQFKSLMSIVKEFNNYRAEMNEKILAQSDKTLKRFFSLDNTAYQDGALDKKTKELLGLVASMVLRCDDCIRYHLGTCFELGISKEQVFEVFTIANLVGGSICIPHTRRAVEYWEALEQEQTQA